MPTVGYAHLCEALDLKVIAPLRTAMIKPVTRITLIDDCLAVPHSVAPAQHALFEHVLFAPSQNLAILGSDGCDLSHLVFIQ